MSFLTSAVWSPHDADASCLPYLAQDVQNGFQTCLNWLRPAPAAPLLVMEILDWLQRNYRNWVTPTTKGAETTLNSFMTACSEAPGPFASSPATLVSNTRQMKSLQKGNLHSLSSQTITVFNKQRQWWLQAARPTLIQLGVDMVAFSGPCPPLQLGSCSW